MASSRTVYVLVVVMVTVRTALRLLSVPSFGFACKINLSISVRAPFPPFSVRVPPLSCCPFTPHHAATMLHGSFFARIPAPRFAALRSAYPRVPAPSFS